MFETLFTFIDQIVTQNIGNMVGVFSSTIAPLLGACVILYAIYLAYQSLYEPENLIVMESMKFIGSLSVVTFIAFNTVWYMDNIVPAVLGSGDQIAQALLGGADAGGGSSLQMMFNKMLTQINSIWGGVALEMLQPDTWLDGILSVGLVILIVVGFVPFLAIATSYLLVAKVMVSFLLIIGPLFIMMSFFPSTRSFFQAWTGQCFNYTLLSIMYPLAFTMYGQVLDATVFTASLSMSTLLMTVVVFAVLILLSVQIPTFCSTLSGGIGISGLTGGIVGSIKSMMTGGKADPNKDSNKLSNNFRDIGKGKIKPG